MLDLFAASFVEVKSQYEEKITNGEVCPRLFVVYPEYPNVWKYEFEVCKIYREEEKKLAYAHNKYL